jgi:hypothetical protein
MAIALMAAWLVATGLATGMISDGNFQSQSSGLISTSLDTADADACQNEKLSAAVVDSIGIEFCETLTSLFVKAPEAPGSWRQDDDSYQLNCVFLL